MFRIATLALLALFVFAVTSFSSEPEQATEVGVSTLMKSPDKYTQQIRVSGVVSQVVEDAKIFGIIDLEEFKACNKVTCASLVLPVRWEGTMPDVGQQLTLTGKVQKEGERYLFIASDLVVVPKKPSINDN